MREPASLALEYWAEGRGALSFWVPALARFLRSNPPGRPARNLLIAHSRTIMTTPVIHVAGTENWSAATDARSHFILCALTPQWTKGIFPTNGSVMNVRSGTIHHWWMSTKAYLAHSLLIYNAKTLVLSVSQSPSETILKVSRPEQRASTKRPRHQSPSEHTPPSL